MSGKRITQRQASLYMSKRQQGHSQVTSAAKADISERSGRRIEKGERKSVPAGHQGLSDFSHPNTEITIKGEVFPHLLYQFRFAYSGWRYVQITLGGESYCALAEGLQSALFLAGGSPIEHRTDSLSAAFVNSVVKR